MKKILLTIILLCNIIYSESIISISHRYGSAVNINTDLKKLREITGTPTPIYAFSILPGIQISYSSIPDKHGLKLGLEYSLYFEQITMGHILTPSISYVNNDLQLPISIGLGLGIILPKEINYVGYTATYAALIPAINIESAIKINNNHHIGLYSKIGALIPEANVMGINICQVFTQMNISCTSLYAEVGLLYRFNISL